jgi:hypothetical protein
MYKHTLFFKWKITNITNGCLDMKSSWMTPLREYCPTLLQELTENASNQELCNIRNLVKFPTNFKGKIHEHGNVTKEITI